MKKLLLLVIGIFLLTGCTNYSNIEKIKYADLKAKLENKESFVVVFTNNEKKNTEDESYDYKTESTTLKSTLNKALAENNINAYEVVYSDLTQEEKNELRPIIDIENYGIVFVKEGNDPTILNHVTDHTTTKYDIIDRLKTNGFIKEEK